MRRAAGLLATSALALLMHGCAAPLPEPPAAQVPAAWRNPADHRVSLTDRPWGAIFQSPELESLVREALAANADLAIAVQRVELARAQFGIQRSFLFPQVGATFAYDRQRLPVGGFDENKVYESALLGLALSTWEIDVWGRVRAAAEGARRELAAADETRLAAQVSIVAQVASLYLQLLELDAQLEISTLTLAARRESLRLVELRYRGGVASKLEVQDATTLVAQAEQTIAEIGRVRSRTENALSLVVGRLPGPIVRERTLREFAIPAQLPAGMPSELLLRRPDLRAAEQALYAADASVEAARKAFYPSITLTGLLGFASPALRDLLDGGRYAWQVSPAVALPLFTAGRLQSNLEATQAQREIALEQYRAAVRNAFREVEDALSDVERYSEERAALAKGVAAHRERLRLSELRYKGGVASYFEVLDSSRQLFQAELQLVQALRGQYGAVIDLYRALGGGYEANAPSASVPEARRVPAGG
ncbi:MAG: multidrug transporter [Betaproteobacteria bacterium]|nr:MAG: multidrug transporter [Betaproteobacteria bacterium]